MKKSIMLLTLILSFSFITVGQAEVRHFRGKTASAFTLFSQDPTGCITSNTTIVGFEQLERSSPGPKSSSSSVLIEVFQVDRCINAPFGTIVREISEIVDINSADLNFDSLLRNATLKTSVIVFDTIQNQDVTVDIDLSWTGIGKNRHIRSHSSIALPGSFIIMFHENRTIRFAELSGTVFLGSDPVNLAQIALGNVVISSSKSGELIRTSIGAK